MSRSSITKNSSSDYSYQDSSEDTLLDFFSSQPSPVEEQNFLLKHIQNWPIRYHLDPTRHNLLNWFPFTEKASFLEIGAGCGALTGLFAQKCHRITALEPDKKRLAILQARHRRFSSKCRFLQKTIQEYQPTKEKFDYVSLIGVLEYSPQSNLSAIELIKKTKCFLKKTGTLIVAIENKLALKYFAGEPEDHTGQAFDSLNDYPRSSQVQTFSHQELSSIFQQAGFNSLEYYYPFPDYKLPQSIFHQSLLEEKSTYQSIISFNQLFDHTRLSPESQQSFSGPATAYQLQKNGLLSYFMPSFLVFART